MSYRKDHVLSFKHESHSNYVEGKTEETLNNLFAEIMQNGIHGFCFSIYEDGQKPGDIISIEQVRKRMEIIKPHTRWVRSFSCIEGNEFVPIVAKEMGLKTLVGAWLGNDAELNQRELDGLIKLAKEGFVDIASVGNEVMYRKDLTEDELLEYMRKTKAEIPNIPLGYVDAYYEFTDRPRITELCDIILCNCYPFWEGCPVEHSLDYMKQMYNQAVLAGNGKKVIITETGWPSQGQNLKGAYPSEKSARDYFINTQLWSEKDQVPIFYFATFDESWKVDAEGLAGAYWGIWDKDEQLKF
ncbi:MAG: glycosyl hydrolase family 17 protein [bacterium]|nr:glycosyl hydrolase family 17 protein [bacterium]